MKQKPKPPTVSGLALTRKTVAQVCGTIAGMTDAADKTAIRAKVLLDRCNFIIAHRDALNEDGKLIVNPDKVELVEAIALQLTEFLQSMPDIESILEAIHREVNNMPDYSKVKLYEPKDILDL